LNSCSAEACMGVQLRLEVKYSGGTGQFGSARWPVAGGQKAVGDRQKAGFSISHFPFLIFHW
jgi:hypothetical protein